MMKLKRVGAPVPSPDGKWVVFDCVDVDLEANTRISHLWIVPANGGESRRLNQTPNHEERPRFSPDGKRLIWTSKATDPTQIWMCDFDSKRGAHRQAASGDGNLNRRGWRDLVARWQEHRVRVGGLSGLQRRRVQQATRRRAEEEQSKSENLFAIVLSALERVHGIQAQPFVCAECGGARVRAREMRLRPARARPHYSQEISRRAITMCRRSR